MSFGINFIDRNLSFSFLIKKKNTRGCISHSLEIEISKKNFAFYMIENLHGCDVIRGDS